MSGIIVNIETVMVKSQIFVAIIVCLLLELIRRTIAENPKGLTEKIRMTLVFYLSLRYVCNKVGEGVKKISPKEIPKINFQKNLKNYLSIN